MDYIEKKMYKNRRTTRCDFFLLVILIFLGSCKEEAQDATVASAYGKDLKISDVRKIYTVGQNYNDSIKLVQRYVKSWVRQQVLLHQAEMELTTVEKDKSRQLEDYQRELLIYELEKKLLNKRVDTVPSLSEIKKYYNENRKEFELKKNLARLYYIKLKKTSPRIDKVKAWFYLQNEVTQKNLESYAAIYADNYFFDDKVWLSFDDILKEIPLNGYDEEAFIRNNHKTILEDVNFLYFIDIKDFRIKNDVSPLEVEINNIRNILINKKKLEYISTLETRLVRAAESGKEVEIFIDQP
jgi:hypothetical protein